jgi:molybdopterin synthase catalytic subunit
MIQLTHEIIDTDAVLRSVSANAAGAVVLFLGTTREFTAGRQTSSLDYECYPEMAEKKLAELLDGARQRWPLIKATIVHRLGQVELGEASVAVAVSTAHRQAAFTAAQWIMDELKASVPIWKKENWTDGRSEWVHPGVKPADLGDTPAGGHAESGKRSTEY